MYKVVDLDSFFTTMLLTQLYLKFVIFITCGKHLHNRFISLRREAWAHKTNYPDTKPER
jgi:hypothetical protein